MEFLKVALPWFTAVFCVLVLVFNHIKARKDKKEGKDTEGNYRTEGMCLGMCIGSAFGSGWLSLGMLIGLAIGMFIQKK